MPDERTGRCWRCHPDAAAVVADPVVNETDRA